MIGQTAPCCVDVTRKTGPELHAPRNKAPLRVENPALINTISSLLGGVLTALILGKSTSSIHPTLI